MEPVHNTYADAYAQMCKALEHHAVQLMAALSRPLLPLAKDQPNQQWNDPTGMVPRLQFLQTKLLQFVFQVENLGKITGDARLVLHPLMHQVLSDSLQGCQQAMIKIVEQVRLIKVTADNLSHFDMINPASLQEYQDVLANYRTLFQFLMQISKASEDVQVACLSGTEGQAYVKRAETAWQRVMVARGIFQEIN